jgi:hypothetical protein
MTMRRRCSRSRRWERRGKNVSSLSPSRRRAATRAAVAMTPTSTCEGGHLRPRASRSTQRWASTSGPPPSANRTGGATPDPSQLATRAPSSVRRQGDRGCCARRSAPTPCRALGLGHRHAAAALRNGRLGGRGRHHRRWSGTAATGSSRGRASGCRSGPAADCGLAAAARWTTSSRPARPSSTPAAGGLRTMSATPRLFVSPHTHTPR